jgi:hypothetical protein
MPTLAIFIFQSNFIVLFTKLGIFGFYVFPTVYEGKHISWDPVISLEMTFYYPLSREIDFSGKWESLLCTTL